MAGTSGREKHELLLSNGLCERHRQINSHWKNRSQNSWLAMLSYMCIFLFLPQFHISELRKGISILRPNECVFGSSQKVNFRRDNFLDLPDNWCPSSCSFSPSPTVALSKVSRKYKIYSRWLCLLSCMVTALTGFLYFWSSAHEFTMHAFC